ncbi:MAG: hypothetical protein ACR2M1_14520 [Gemmatimonadaceae bacterium]
MMHYIHKLNKATRAATTIGTLAVVAAAAGCSRDTLLGVDNPNVIDPSALNSPDGAEGLRVGAITRFKAMTATGESSWLFGGLLTDEWKSTDTFTQRDETDQRTVTEENSFVAAMYRNIHRTRVGAYQAIQSLRQYKATAVGEIGEMWFLKGYSELQSASDFCNGQPFADLSSGTAELSNPVDVSTAFTMALASFDSSLAAVGSATDTVSVRVRASAQVGRGRALLGLGRFTDAAAAVKGVPASFAFNLTFPASQGKEDNIIWVLNINVKRYTVQDSLDPQGGIFTNGMPFVSAKDPRVPTSVIAKTGIDGVTPHVVQGVFPSFNSVVPVANGVDAQLIDAEARLKAGDPTWLTVLNSLRAGPTSIGTLTISKMAPLTDPGTDQARLLLLFRERAFWTYGRGQRLGDLRRLIHTYNETPAQVFPGQGAVYSRKNGPYGSDVNFPVPQAERNNGNFKGCTDRKA